MGFEEVGEANRHAGTLALPLCVSNFFTVPPAEGNLVTYLPQNVSLALNCTNRAPRVDVNAPKLLALILVEIPMKFV